MFMFFMGILFTVLFIIIGIVVCQKLNRDDELSSLPSRPLIVIITAIILGVLISSPDYKTTLIIPILMILVFFWTYIEAEDWIQLIWMLALNFILFSAFFLVELFLYSTLPPFIYILSGVFCIAMFFGFFYVSYFLKHRYPSLIYPTNKDWFITLKFLISLLIQGQVLLMLLIKLIY